MDQMDVSVDVTVTQTPVDNDIIDDGVPMEDIDDMEIDFLFSKCDDEDLNVAKPNVVIELSDDEEKIEKIVPEDSKKYVQNDIQNVVQVVNKKADTSMKFIKILPRPAVPKPPVNSPKTPSNSEHTTKKSTPVKLNLPRTKVNLPKTLGSSQKTIKKTATPLKFKRIFPHRPVMTIQPPTPANRQFQIAIQSNIKIINHDLGNMTPPTVNYTISTKPAAQPNPNIKKPPLILKKIDKPKLIQPQFTKSMPIIIRNNKQAKGNTILRGLLNQNNQTSKLKPVTILHKVNPDNLKYKFQNLKTLAVSPSYPKQTFSVPPKSDIKNCNVLKKVLVAELLNKTSELEPKNVIKIKKEIPDPQDMIVEEITTKEHQFSHAGVFKAMHDASGAIVDMIQETPNQLNDEIQVKLETPDLPDVGTLECMETLDSLDEGMHEILTPVYPEVEISNFGTLHLLDDELQSNLMTPDYPEEETCDLGTLHSPNDEMQSNLMTPYYPDEDLGTLDLPDEEIQENSMTPAFSDALEESTFNFIDKKLLAVTTVQLDDWSVVLSNSTRYCSLCQTLFPSRAVLDEHQAQWHPLLVPCVEEEGYYCQQCDTSFHDKYYLDRHLRSHNNITHSQADETELECFVCHVRFVSQHALHIHVSAEHVRTFSCHCGKEFPFQDLLDAHVKTDHARSTPEASDKPQDVVKHQAQMILVQKTALFKCATCDIHFTDYWKAKIHYAHCSKNKSIGQKCARCPRLITRFDTSHRRQHKLKCNLKTYTVNNLLLNVISECPKCLLHYNILRKPNFTHHVKYCKGPGAEYFECCGLKLTEQRYFVHKKHHDSKRDFIVLKYGFYEPNTNEGSSKTIEKDTNLKRKTHAPQDEAESSTQPNKKRKLELTFLLQKTALFECETCKAGFTSYYRAQKHYDQCTSDTILKKCPYCPKFISSKNHRYQHLMRCKLKTYNVNEKPLCVLSECPKCRRHFRESETFNDHVKECRGPTKNYVKCCGYKFNQYQYSLHKKKHDDSDDRDYIVLKYMLNVSREEKQREEKVRQNVNLPKIKGTEAECPTCGLRIHKYRLARHMTVHSLARPFKCGMCYFSSKWEGDLKRHEEKCRGNEIDAVWYNCSICEYKTKHKSSLQTHSYSHNLDGRDSVLAQQKVQRERQNTIPNVKSTKQCPICGLDLRGRGRISRKRHMQDHISDRPFKCDNRNCFFSTKYAGDLTRHKEKCQGNETNVTWYACRLCEFKSKYKVGLKNHINQIHVRGCNSSKSESKEDSVNEEVPTDMLQKVQPRNREETEKRSTEKTVQMSGNKHECHICGIHVTNLKSHMVVHSSVRPFKCNKCFYSTKRSTDLIKHQKTCRGNRLNANWYDCNQCEFKTRSIWAFQYHIEAHALEKNDEASSEITKKEEQNVGPRKIKRKPRQGVCPICGLYRSNLRQHMVVHDSVRPFKCNNCFFSAKRPHHLIVHKQNYCQGKKTNQAWYDCSQCEFKSRSKQALRTHVDCHARECTDAFVSEAPTDTLQKVERKREDINRHMEVHRPFKCDNCFFSAKRAFPLAMHKLSCRRTKQNKKWYDCRHCDFKTMRMGSLKKHIKSHGLELENADEYNPEAPTEHKVEPQRRQNKIKRKAQSKISKCRLCGRHVMNLKKHMLAHSSVRPFKCDKCFYSTKRLYELTKHKKSCQGNKSNTTWYDCGICEYKTISKFGLGRHKKNHAEYNNSVELHSEVLTEERKKLKPTKDKLMKKVPRKLAKKKKCHVCGIQCNDLRRHMFVHSSIRPYKCNKCYFSTKWSDKLLQHRLNCKGNENNVMRHDCNFCEFKSTSKHGFIVHMRSHQRKKEIDLEVPIEEGEEVVPLIPVSDSVKQKQNSEETNLTCTVWHNCTICEFKTKCKQTLQRHIETHGLERNDLDELDSEEKQEVETRKRKSCHICGQRCADLSTHMQVHSAERPYKCDQCFFSTKRLFHLMKHEKKCQGNSIDTVWYDCSFCEFKSTDKRGLSRHTATHTLERNDSDVETEKNNNCHICGRHFADLQKHMLVHSSVRPFKCDMCYYSTKWSSDLTKHKRTCMGIKPNTVWYDCAICEYKTTNKLSLKRHTKGHSFERNKSDELASEVPRDEGVKVKTLIRSSDSIKHKKSSEETNLTCTVWHDCTICEFKTKCKQTLQRHIETHGLERNDSDDLDSEEKQEIGKRKRKSCHICGQHCADLSTHMQVHSAERPYKCDQCFYSTKHSSDLGKHKKICQGTSIDTVWYDCSFCEFKTLAKRGLFRHLACHALERNDSEVKTEEILPPPNLVEPRKSNDNIRKPPKNHNCHICGGYFIDLQRHMQVHSSERPYKCDQCFFSAKQSSDLRRHQKKCRGTSIDTVWYDCSFCEFKTLDKRGLHRHSACHALERNDSDKLDSEVPREEGEKEESLIRSSDLIKHKKISEETNSTCEVWHGCTICEFKTKCKQTLQRHIKAHGLERNNLDELHSEVERQGIPLHPDEVEPQKSEDNISKPPIYHECHICGKHVADLQKHMQVHSAVRPFKCNKCYFASKRSCDLIKHKKICKGIKPNAVLYDCTICEFKSLKKCTIKVHIESHALERNDMYELESKFPNKGISCPSKEVTSTSAEVPLPSEKVPVTTEEVPLPSIKVPVTSEAVPSPIKTAPLFSEEVPVTSVEVPVTSEEVPDTSEVPFAFEAAPLLSEEVPLPSLVVRLPTEKVPLTSNAVSSSSQKLPLPYEEDPVPSQELPHPTEEVPAPSQELPLPTKEVPALSQELPLPTKEVPAPSQKLPLPTEEVPAPSQELPLPTKEVSAPSQDLPLPTKEVLAPSQELPFPTEEVPAPFQLFPYPTDEVPALSQELPHPTKEVPAASQELPLPTEEVPAPSQELPYPTEEVPAPFQELPHPTEEVPALSQELPLPTKEAPSPSPEVPPSEKAHLPSSELPEHSEAPLPCEKLSLSSE